MEVKKVWVNGSFDIVHIGHIRLLEYASTLGEVMVGLDTDSRIKQLKGENRPFNCLADRIDFIRSIKYVTDVLAFSSNEGLINLIADYQPDYMVIGSDYKDKPIIGAEYIKEIIYFDRVEGKSTTTILNYEKDISNR